MLELDSNDTFVKPFHWSSISQAYTRALHAQDFPKINDYGYVLYYLLEC